MSQSGSIIVITHIEEERRNNVSWQVGYPDADEKFFELTPIRIIVISPDRSEIKRGIALALYHVVPIKKD